MDKIDPDKAGSEFDAYRDNYSDTVNESIAFSGLDVDFFTRAKATRLLELLSRHVGSPADLSVLDVGCGVGNYHGVLKDRIGKLTGVDPSAECIAEARQRHPDLEYATYDGERIPYPADHFDAAYAICVMHHVLPEIWPVFASELARVTRPGGIVAIFEHNPYNPVTRRIVSNCPFDENAVLLSKRSVVKHLRSAGLSVAEGRYILTLPAESGIFRRIDNALGFLPMGAQYYVAGQK